jgi:glycogen synthase
MSASNPNPTQTHPGSDVAEQPAVAPSESRTSESRPSGTNGNGTSHEHSPNCPENQPRTESNSGGGKRKKDRKDKSQRVVALFCYEAPDSGIGQYVGQLAMALSKRQLAVHIFACKAFDLPGIASHPVGDPSEKDMVDAVTEFGKRACEAFHRHIPAGAQVSLIGHEWSAIPAMVQLRLSESLDSILLLGSLERQRSDMGHSLNQRIDEVERAGLRDAQAILTHGQATSDAARAGMPECASRVHCLREAFPTHRYQKQLDQGEIKAKYQVGPIDPMILYFGDFDSRHGPDVLMRAVAPVLRNHPQARFVFAGDGELFWPLKVHARYQLLENAIRLPGSVEGAAMDDLIQAADIIAVPSREVTEWWPIQSAWAAERPVVASHCLGQAMGLQHEKEAVLVFPHESSVVWGIERLLYDRDLQTKMAQTAKSELESRFGWGGVAQQICDLMGISAATPSP